MYIFWAITGIFFIVSDLKKTSVIKLTFANSFLFLAILAYKFPSNYTFQAISFLGLTIVFYFLIKNILNNEKKDFLKAKTLVDFKDKIAIVTKDIGKTLSIDGIGTVKIDNNQWSAKSIDDKEIKKGQKVQIISKENMILNVKVIDYAKNK